MKTQRELAKELKEIKKTSDNKLEKEVINDLLNAENIEGYINDILQHGCQSGVVGGLIYYTDTKKFFIKFMDEIEEIKERIEDEQGEPLKMGSPSFNWLAWLAFEEITRDLSGRLGLDY